MRKLLTIIFVALICQIPLGSSGRTTEGGIYPSKVSLVALKPMPSSKLEDVSEVNEIVIAIQPAYNPGCSDPKSCIYSRESGNDPTKYNSIGCLGLGQACPGSKLLSACPTMDYGCEDQWFTSYMEGRYGSWDNAWAFWQANNWW